MPLVKISTNGSCGLDQKKQMAAALTELFCTTLKIATAHMHVQVQGDVFLSLGGNTESPAALVGIKAADNSITKDARKALVTGISSILHAHINGLSGDHVYMTFNELPVQNFAVGSTIMTFDTMHTAKSTEHIPETAP